ncbi:FG-GAP repeat domain-containing protein [Streptomyces sp. NPDC057494]|uniref:FG-GAP repeat domain-containing protein n=1 Tax=Streptomyces sp. NPDC057494 TaxID=3346148 RepID=UPI0036979496
MQHPSSARRLVAAVAAVLAVTSTAALAATPATAATAAEAPARPAGVTAAFTVDNDLQLVSAGTTGFLSRKPGGALLDGWQYYWTTYADGTTKSLDPAYQWFGGGSDVVFSRKPTETSYFVHDMAHPSNFLVGLSGNGAFAGAIGRNAVFTSQDSDGLDVTLKRLVTGTSQVTTLDVPLPADARVLRVQAGTVDAGLIQYARGFGDETTFYLAAVDLGNGQIIQTVPTGSTAPRSGVFLTDTHVGWVGNPTGSSAALLTVARGGEGTPASFALGATPVNAPLDAAAVGGWAVTTQKGGGLAEQPSAQYPLVARSLSNPGSPVRLLDHAGSMTTAPDGSVLVRGGSLSQGGEGVYRIAADPSGTPVATLVATTGRKTELGLAATAVPSVVDFDRNGGRAALSWTLSRYNGEGTVTLRHVASGRKATRSFSGRDYAFREGGGRIDFAWDGLLAPNTGGTAGFAPAGDYVWELKAKPLNGIGPDLSRTGTFKVARKTGLHDYTGNGSPDVLARDASGRLFRDDTVITPSSTEVYSSGRTQVGTGWQVYNLLEAVGDVAGGTAPDLLARDASGVLWLYQGNGNGGFGTRAKVGPGWNTYKQLTGGSDLNGDGRADLLATDGTGALWFYKGTGSASTPFATRVKVGGGWGAYNQITAVGDLAGSAAGDLVARDTAGVLWFYPGDGRGNFGTRVKVGGGWGGFTHLVGVGDADRDGRADLYAAGPSGSRLYPGSGIAASPLKPGVFTSVHSDAARFNSIF